VEETMLSIFRPFQTITRRVLEQKMIDYLDQKLVTNGLAQEAIQTKNARLLFAEAAKVCVGIREKTGHNDGPMVELIQETIGGHSHEAWCMAFVQTCLAYAELKTGVLSPILASEGCDQVWNGTDKAQRVAIFPFLERLSFGVITMKMVTTWAATPEFCSVLMTRSCTPLRGILPAEPIQMGRSSAKAVAFTSQPEI